MKSIWLNASAGTGKTKSLVERYIKLLDYGYKPHEILCITFTNNAALEMQNRIFDAIKNNDKFLDYFVKHSFRIQTLHSFAQEIIQAIHNIKIEQILDDHHKKVILKKLLLAYFQKHPDITKKLANLYSFDFFLNMVVQVTQRFSERFNTVDDFDTYEDFIPILKNVPEEFEYLKALQEDQKEYFNFFLTQKGVIRKSVLKKEDEKKYPDFAKLVYQEAESVFQYTQSQKIQDWISKNQFIVKVMNDVLEEFILFKESNQFYDFKDLLFQSIKLLENQDHLFQVTKNIQHILIDEVQDISFYQWKLITKLTENFFNDASLNHTLFAVGDNKQNIYTFQDAHPKYYNYYKAHYKAVIGDQFIEETLHENYRSLSDVVHCAEITCKNLNIPTQKVIRAGKGKVEKVHIPDNVEYIEYAGQFIESLLKSKVVLPSTGQVIQPKDILILFRKRDESFEEFITYFSNKTSIPVTFEKKTLLQDESLMHILHCVITLQIWPDDPYSLYHTKQTLFEGLRFKTMNDFIQFLMTHMDSITKSYGGSSYSILETFFKICTELQTKLPLTFYILKDHLDNVPIMLEKDKKDENALSIMTIHGAKGLQFPVVFMFDTSSKAPHSQFMWDLESNSLYTMPPSDIYHPVIQGLRSRHKEDLEEEKERLLYVAITRAQDQFYFVPYKDERKGCYYHYFSYLN